MWLFLYRIKSVEVSRLHDGSKEPVKVHHPSSPLSRAAQLVTLAAKIPSQYLPNDPFW